MNTPNSNQQQSTALDTFNDMVEAAERSLTEAGLGDKPDVLVQAFLYLVLDGEDSHIPKSSLDLITHLYDEMNNLSFPLNNIDVLHYDNDIAFRRNVNGRVTEFLRYVLHYN